MPGARLSPPPPVAEFRIPKELFTVESGSGAGGGTFADLDVAALLFTMLLLWFLDPNLSAEIPDLGGLSYIPVMEPFIELCKLELLLRPPLPALFTLIFIFFIHRYRIRR
jgi:hypothetical protein